MRGHFYSFITFCRFKLLIQVSGPSEQDPSFWKQVIAIRYLKF